jgi:hypothetical protein
LFYGSAAGTFGPPGWSMEGPQTLDALNAGVKARFGTDVAGVGDLNLDGFDDFIVGAPGYNYISIQEETGPSGGLFGFFGSAQGPVSRWRQEGGPNAGFGSVVAGGGDINGDGRNDHLVSSPNSWLNRLRVLVQFTGPTGDPVKAVQLTNFDLLSGFGMSVAIAGDLNGDGFDDVVVGAPNIAQAFVYLGTPLGVNTTPSWVVRGPAGFGLSTSSAGDTDGDGFDDLIVGADSQASVFLGSAAGLVTTPAWSNDGGQADSGFGAAVASAGDWNGDGYSDLLVGAPRHDAGEQDEGAAFLYFGGASGPALIPAWIGAPTHQAGASFGASVSRAGDYDGDGLDEVIAGAPDFNSGGASRSGRVDLALTCAICESLDCDLDGLPDCEDNCPIVQNPGQSDGDLDGHGDACDNCPAVPNVDQDPCVCNFCGVLDIAISFSSDQGKGAGTVFWRTGIEHDLSGFNVVIHDNKGHRVQQNPVLIPCLACETDIGADYAYAVPKHRNGRDVFIEQVHLDGRIDTFGPAERR